MNKPRIGDVVCVDGKWTDEFPSAPGIITLSGPHVEATLSDGTKVPLIDVTTFVTPNLPARVFEALPLFTNLDEGAEQAKANDYPAFAYPRPETTDTPDESGDVNTKAPKESKHAK